MIEVLAISMVSVAVLALAAGWYVAARANQHGNGDRAKGGPPRPHASAFRSMTEIERLTVVRLIESLERTQQRPVAGTKHY